MKKIISILLRYVPRRYLQRVSGAGIKMAGLLYAGNQVECPICNHSYRKFLPYGRKPRSNALCPSCLSLERHRLIWLYLKKIGFFSRPLDILHIAPESCFIDKFEEFHGKKYITADIESPLAKIKMDIHHIPFTSNTFDVVLCNHVLEHVEDDIRATKEISRVLKPGGWAILQVPFYSPIPEKTLEDHSVVTPHEREKIFGQRDHVRKYGKDYPSRIAHSSMPVEVNDFGKSLSDQEVQRYSVYPDESLYIGRKSGDE